MRRLIFLFCLALALLSLKAGAQVHSLTETEALRLGLARAELQDIERGSLAAADADVTAAGTWSNPTLDFERERMRAAPRSSDETWRLSQTFDVSGRRGLRQEAAERRRDAVLAGNAARRAEFAAEIRRRFHEVLFGQQTVQAMETWVQRFAGIEARTARLARSGEASGYDRRRLARERQAAQARLATEQARLGRDRERLAALLGKPGGIEATLAGSLPPAPPPPLEGALVRLERRADLATLARRAEAADLEGRAAARGWVPDITLGVGAKRSDNGVVRENGSVATVSIPLPLFDRQQAGEERARAEALGARAEYGLAKRRAEGELRGLHLQAVRLTTAAADYRAATATAAPELLRIAEVAWQGGESSLLELLDAYRGALDSETTALELEWKAREARIDYDLLTGSMTE